ncbi:AAA family ATPase [Shewanella sp. Shew256]|uniref:AAA family ATPase n=1 Tax=Shewanella sp. Shew256 TaxID=1969376 RepID=UPI000B4A45C7|nr:AAA family ATPase [Shewanella sp. Shew256]
MSISNQERQQFLEQFIHEWPVERLESLSLEEYTSVDDQNTFAYWIEFGVGRYLGSIKGGDASKFGIYKRKSEPKGIREFIDSDDVYSWKRKYGSSAEQAFSNIKSKILLVIQAAKHAELEKIELLDFEQVLKWKLAFIYQDHNAPLVLPIYKLKKFNVLLDERPLTHSTAYTKLLQSRGNKTPLEYGMELWRKADELEGKISSEQFDNGDDYLDSAPIAPLNQILFGPPGTGKTYSTIESAVAIAEPEFNWSSRTELKDKYNQLVKEKRIRFVTFHQSYGYEDFVEGLSALSDEENPDVIRYFVKKGIFREICEDAQASRYTINNEINKSGQVWKLSIESAQKNSTKDYCLANGIGAIGWGNTGDLTGGEENSYHQSLGKNAKNSLYYFSQQMQVGDLVLCIDSKTSVGAVGVVTGDYQYVESAVPTRSDFRHQRNITWLATDISVEFKELNGNTSFNLSTCYPLSRLSVADVLEHLNSYGVALKQTQLQQQTQNYVLIIDEINRGNISKIFGELITLIEPSKRSGHNQTEALQVTLQCSQMPFSVPDNLYLIGTMNTADRSLALMDTALRRRFDFKELMPQPSKIAGHPLINGIDLSRLLTTINERISVLYDREHTLGHAFFFPAFEAAKDEDQDRAFELLISAFKNKIIPLLQEYFFDDWQKIRLVLGDNQKVNQDLAFVITKSVELDKLFGYDTDFDLDTSTSYLLQSEGNCWRQPAAYIAIYEPQNAGTL